jgi:hypothetical protein
VTHPAGIHPTGIVQEITPTRQNAGMARLNALMADAERTGAHVWTVNTCHLITADQAARVAADEQAGILLDADSLVAVAPGCFRCEEIITPELLRTRCAGDPEA